MEENKLIKFESGVLQKVGNAIDITNKLVVLNERKKIIELFIDHPNLFIALFSKNYPLNNHQIDKYKDCWEWEYLSSNKGISWNENLIEKYENSWEWSALSNIEELPWNEDLIEKYKEKWHWGNLSVNTKVNITLELISKYEDKWDWNYLCMSKSLIWSEVLEYYSYKFDMEKITSFGFFFYASPTFPWSEDIILKYLNRWNWESISSCMFLPWSENLIDRFIDKWDWESLCSNNSVPWNEKLFDKYKEKLKWDGLSGNHYLPWNEKFIDANIEKINWFKLVDNKGLPWSKAVIEKHIEKWQWNQLSRNKFLPWSIELLKLFFDEWDWTELSKNKSLPWTKELLELYKNEWDWNQMGSNSEIPWSINLIRQYENMLPLNFFGKEKNTSITFKDIGKSNPDKFKQIFLKMREHFQNNPLFSESNPIHKKNKEVYINSLVGNGYSLNILNAMSQQFEIDKNINFKKFIRVNSNLFYKPLPIKTGIAMLNNVVLWQKVFQPYVDNAMIEEVMERIQKQVS